jgi:hypothetical protein
MTPTEAIASSPAMRATALLIADPMPDHFGSIDPRIAEVSGATVAERLTLNSKTPGNNSVQ